MTRRSEDEELLHNMIRDGTDPVEFDGSQFLDLSGQGGDGGNGDDEEDDDGDDQEQETGLDEHNETEVYIRILIGHLD